MSGPTAVEDVDVVVVGSGAGGAPLTATLVRAGRQVVVLEKGPLLRTQDDSPSGLSDFKRDELLATGPEKILDLDVENRYASYFASHVEPDLNDEPHVYEGADGKDRATIEGYTAQVVGGGTQLYGGVSLRFTPDDLRLASFNAGRTLQADPRGDVRAELHDWPISYDDLEPFYGQAERELGINGSRLGQLRPWTSDAYQQPLPPNPIGIVAERGMDALGMARYRTPLAVITADHAPSGRTVADPEEARSAFVNRYGDPLGRKSSTWVALLRPLSSSANLDLRPLSHVTLLESDGTRVVAVRYRDAAGDEHVLRPRTVVVACSAIESVRLLRVSARHDPVGFAARVDPHDQVGRGFLTHCFGGAQGLVDRADKSRSLDSDWATDHLTRPEFLDEHGLFGGGVVYDNTSDSALPLSMARTWGSTDLDDFWKGYLDATGTTGPDFQNHLDVNFGRKLSLTFMANQVPQWDNRIELHPRVTDRWGVPAAYIRKTWHPHDAHLMDVFAQVCREILVAGGTTDTVSAGSVKDSVSRIANHVLGGARFGTDPTRSVLDAWCRVWGVDNLFVTDGAFMPTSGSANPTLTIQANSYRVGEELVRRG